MIACPVDWTAGPYWHNCRRPAFGLFCWSSRPSSSTIDSMSRKLTQVYRQLIRTLCGNRRPTECSQRFADALEFLQRIFARIQARAARLLIGLGLVDRPHASSVEDSNEANRTHALRREHIDTETMEFIH